jgi:hypothetical protein
MKYTASSIANGSRFFMMSSTTKRSHDERDFVARLHASKLAVDVLVMPSDMMSCILHEDEMILVARRSMTRTFQSCRSFCRTDSHRSISLISSTRERDLVAGEHRLVLESHWRRRVSADWTSSCSVVRFLLRTEERRWHVCFD